MPEYVPPARQKDLRLLDGSPLEPLPCIVGFFLAFRIVSVLLAVRALGAGPEVGTAVNVAVDFLLLMVVAFSAMGNHTPLSLLTSLPAMRWVLLFLGFSCCSLSWSIAVSPANSGLYWCTLASDVAMLMMLLRTGPLTAAADSLMKGFVWGACGVALIAWILPAESDLRLGDEELLGPNQIGYVCALAFFFAQYLLRERKKGPAVSAVLLAVTLLRSLSKTTIVAFLIAEGFLLIRDRSISRRTKILISLAAVTVVALFSSLLISYYGVYTAAGNQSETLTGRLGIWAYFLGEAVQQPWIGHGFDSAWKVIPPFGADQFEAAHAHNEVLQQFYAYGAVGIVLFVGIYSSLLVQIRRIAVRSQRTFFLALLLFVVVRGTADTDRFDLSLPLWAVVMVSLLAEHARARAPQMSDILAVRNRNGLAGPRPRPVRPAALLE